MEPVTPITYDRRTVTPGIVHIGVGNFHRAHQAFYVDGLLRMDSASAWGIAGVGILPASPQRSRSPACSPRGQTSKS